jgi:hypothetical protein
MRPAPAQFTKDSPCTKRHIWQCFYGPKGFTRVPVVEAQAKIGVNVPRVMERERRLVVVKLSGVDFYALTPEGEVWLRAGIEAYCRNHPAEVAEIPYLDAAGRHRRKRVSRE